MRTFLYLYSFTTPGVTVAEAVLYKDIAKEGVADAVAADAVADAIPDVDASSGCSWALGCSID